MMLTQEEKRTLLKDKMKNPNISNPIADRFIRNEGNQSVDYSDMQDVLKYVIKRREAKDEEL